MRISRSLASSPIVGWIADVLPHASAAMITPLMEQGARALRGVMEKKRL
jgi:hypothetical protein